MPLAPIIRALGAAAKPLFTAISTYFIADAVVKGTQNIEDTTAGTLVNPAILALPAEEREAFNRGNEKISAKSAITTALAAVVVWELLGRVITKKLR